MAKKDLIAKPGTGIAVQHRTRCMVFELLESRSMLHGEQYDFFVFNYERAPLDDFVDQARPAEFHGGGRSKQHGEPEFNPRPSQLDRELPRGEVVVLVATPANSLRPIAPPPAPLRAIDSVLFSVSFSQSPNPQTPPLNRTNGSIADFISPKNSSINGTAVDKLLADERSTAIARNQTIASPTVTNDSLRNVDSKADRAVSPTSSPAVRSSAASVATEQSAGSRAIGLDGMLSLRSTGANTATPGHTNDADSSSKLFGIGSTEAIDVLMRNRWSEVINLGESAEKELRIGGKHWVIAGDSWQSNNLRFNQPSNKVDPWPEGMLSIGSVVSPLNSAPTALASMDPVAIVQMFIRAGELSGMVSSPSSHTAATEAATSPPAAWLKWLKDPRVSMVVSLTLGLIAAATSRQTKQPHIAVPTFPKKRFFR